MEGTIYDVDFGSMSDADNTLFFNNYQMIFEIKYGSHSCDTPGCPHTTVADGHVKVRRYVCVNRCHPDSFIQMEGWPVHGGRVVGGFFTGCPHAPQWRYGKEHPKAKFCKSCDGVAMGPPAATTKPSYITPVNTPAGYLPLTCATDKAEPKKSVVKPDEERTAGTLAIMTPCGMIICAREMQRHER
jgi:hypothetical protein